MWSVGGLTGALTYGYLCNKFGRHLTIKTIVIPQLISFLLIAYATNALEIVLSRTFAGFSGGAIFVTLPLFISEISEDA